MQIKINHRYVPSHWRKEVYYVYITDFDPVTCLYSGRVNYTTHNNTDQMDQKWRFDGTAIDDARDNLDCYFYDNGEVVPASTPMSEPEHNCFLDGHEMPDAGGLAFNYCKHCDTKFLWNRSMWMWEEANKQPMAS